MNPLTILQTKRLELRAIQPEEEAQLTAALTESADKLKPWINSAALLPASAELTLQYIYTQLALMAADHEFNLGIFLKADNTLVGMAGLCLKDPNIPSYSVGYWCREGFQRQGYVVEAVKRLIEFGFETMPAKRIYLSMDPRNDGSRMVAENADLPHEGIFRNYRTDFEDGITLRDRSVYALTDTDYTAWKKTHGA